MPFGEWATIPIVIVVSQVFSVIVGILAGLLIGCVNFTRAYGLSSPVRARYFGDVAISNVWRSHSDREMLWENNEDRLVLYLQGFLFFGTANRLLKEVCAYFDQAPHLRRLILDFTAVEGVDSSALSALQCIEEIVKKRKIDLLFASTPASIKERLNAPLVRFTSNLDEALELSEELTISEADHVSSEPETLKRTLIANHGIETAEVILNHFSETIIPAGGIIFSQGEEGNELAFIESGRASVLEKFEDRPSQRVRTLVAGTMVGELGFYVDEQRTATIICDTDCCIIRITPEDIDRLETDHAHLALEFHRMIARRLCLRINDKDHLIAVLARAMTRS